MRNERGKIEQEANAGWELNRRRTLHVSLNVPASLVVNQGMQKSLFMSYDGGDLPSAVNRLQTRAGKETITRVTVNETNTLFPHDSYTSPQFLYTWKEHTNTWAKRKKNNGRETVTKICLPTHLDAKWCLQQVSSHAGKSSELRCQKGKNCNHS